LTCIQYPIPIAPNYERIIIDFIIASSVIYVCAYLPSSLTLTLGGFWVIYPFSVRKLWRRREILCQSSSDWLLDNVIQITLYWQWWCPRGNSPLSRFYH
jgi:hypothetical protein